MGRAPTDTIKFLTLDELARLFIATRANARDRALFLVAYRHGLRASEVGLLRIDDIDFRALRLAVHRVKGSHSGTHPLQTDEVKALKAYLRERPDPPSPVLFPSNRGDPIARRTLDWLMKRYGAVADLSPPKRHFHCLKHSISLSEALDRHPPARGRRRPSLRPGLAWSQQHPEHRRLHLPYRAQP